MVPFVLVLKACPVAHRHITPVIPLRTAPRLLHAAVRRLSTLIARCLCVLIFPFPLTPQVNLVSAAPEASVPPFLEKKPSSISR